MIMYIIGNIPLIVCHLLYVVGRYYKIPDIRKPSTLILSSQIMYRYVLWQMRFSVTEAHYREGVFYFKLMNKTSWQAHFFANIGCSGRCIMPESGTETGSGSRSK